MCVDLLFFIIYILLIVVVLIDINALILFLINIKKYKYETH